MDAVDPGVNPPDLHGELAPERVDRLFQEADVVAARATSGAVMSWNAVSIWSWIPMVALKQTGRRVSMSGSGYASAWMRLRRLVPDMGRVFEDVVERLGR